jgi:hypothetical protein
VWKLSDPIERCLYVFVDTGSKVSGEEETGEETEGEEKRRKEKRI